MAGGTQVAAMMTELNLGFSIVVAPLLFISYSFFLKSSNKNFISILLCGLFLSALTGLQWCHWLYIKTDYQPLESDQYKALLFLVPALFYFFSQVTLFSHYQFKLKSLLHLSPLLALLISDQLLVVPIAFVVGCFYCFWLMKLIYGMREHRRRFNVEFFFIALFSLFAVFVLIFGFSLSYIDNAYFYYFYANGITLSYILVTGALIIYPDLLNELTEAVKLSYASSTLNKVDIAEKLKQLEELMTIDKIYENENLSLSQLAKVLDLSGHQLSELINTQYHISFSRYLRGIRVERAKELLKSEPGSSVLSISMETGFKSQSNFYSAFKEIEGQSPGSYRKG